MNLHLTDDQFIDRLYSEEATPDAHLEACPHCARRWEAFQERRAWTRASLAPDATHLAWQRRRIVNRLDQTPRHALRWAAAMATGLLLAAGVWMYGPAAGPQTDLITDSMVAASQPAVETVEISWFEDTYSATQSDEPRAASPMRVLFEPQEEKVTE